MAEFGYKLYSDDDTFFYWSSSAQVCQDEARFQKSVYGRDFQVAAVTLAEYRAFQLAPTPH